MSSPPSSPAVQFPIAASSEEAFRHLEDYQWNSDEEFQAGLRAILGPSPAADSAQTEDLTLRARCFYYSRKAGAEVDFSSYRAWRESQLPSTLTPLQLQCVKSEPIGLTSTAPSNLSETKFHDESLAGLDTEVPINEGSSTSQGHYPSKFAEIVDLIQSGKPIPGIKDIPDTILLGQSSESSQPKRAKPWE